MIPGDQYRRIVLAHLRKVSKPIPIRDVRLLARESMTVDVHMERLVWNDLIRSQGWVSRFRRKGVLYVFITMEGRKASKFFDRMF